MDEFIEEKLKGFFELDEIGIVGHIRGGGAEMDDRFGVRALVSKSVDMGHYVMAEPFFVEAGGGKVDFIDVVFQLSDLLVSDWKSELLLCFGESCP